MSILGNTRPAYDKSAMPPGGQPGMPPQPLQWNFASGPMAGKPYNGPMDPLAMAQQAQQMAMQQQATPGPAGSSYSEITRGAPQDFDALRLQLAGGGMREDPKPGDKNQGGGGGGGQNQTGGNGQVNTNAPFSWGQWDALPGVKPYDMTSVMNYMAGVNRNDPNDQLDWGKIFRTGAGGRQNR